MTPDLEIQGVFRERVAQYLDYTRPAERGSEVVWISFQVLSSGADRHVAEFVGLIQRQEGKAVGRGPE